MSLRHSPRRCLTLFCSFVSRLNLVVIRMSAKQKPPRCPSPNGLGGSCRHRQTGSFSNIVLFYPLRVKQQVTVQRNVSNHSANGRLLRQARRNPRRMLPSLQRQPSLQISPSILTSFPALSRPPSPPAFPQSATPSSPPKRPRRSPLPNSPKPSVVRKSLSQPSSTAKPRRPRLMLTSCRNCSVWTRNS